VAASKPEASVCLLEIGRPTADVRQDAMGAFGELVRGLGEPSRGGDSSFFVDQPPLGAAV